MQSRKKNGPPEREAPRRREATVRISNEISRHLCAGHPWVYRDSLKGRRVDQPSGKIVDILEGGGAFVARALYESEGPIALRVFSRVAGRDLGDVHLLEVVEAAARWRRSECDVGPEACLRVLNGDSEGVPATTVDCYGGYLVVCAYSAVVETYLKSLLLALEKTWRPAGVYLQRRYLPPDPGKPRPPAELLSGNEVPTEVIVREGGVRFAVDVTAPSGTGLFADMRLGRQRLAELAGGKRLLNCFSYAGAFSVVGAVHGALEVVSVDSAARAHGRARRNLAINGIAEDDARCEFVTGDTFATLARFAERKRFFDLVVVDPPTFSSAKGNTFSALRDYGNLIRAAAEVVVPGGAILAASNAAKMSSEDFEKAIAGGIGDLGRRALITSRLGQPPDYPAAAGFPEGKYLKIATVRVF